ncbi:putative protein serine/threonine kinase [Heterostelium album PN500]|uniref:Protein kinase domain-containing protein n=1 Tax=Heterostelium pallidum (strain ATCC 26659 / Pp 5 / PN500) TaxID=670386 RepID=D3BBX4_HETP5|nr:putative protein serine/threonine kinase [Heterostelium album PN500]EFA81157.1 putative protein serine/threonine kinase [Heterostelium album PN500]|eukprot:XP_020433275.1 putative protein serine/threonine kinase [Heterostelium album PN500]
MIIDNCVQQPGGGFTTNSLIKARWTVIKKIGQGAFGEIYSGKNIINNEYVAIKVEKIDTKKQVLKLEVAVLKKLQACPYVCRFITCGRHGDYNYMVMELLGDNLSDLRRRQVDGKFSMTTTLKLGIQMIQSLEAVHDLGYLHRDVKPSNFAIGLGPNKRHITYLIDFGLNLLRECYTEKGGVDNTPFDWELTTATTNQSNTSTGTLQLPKVTLPSPSTVEVEASRSRENDSQRVNSKPNKDSPPIENETGSPQPQIHRKDSASASVIAASSEAENKSGSWNNKSSPRTKKDHAGHQLHSEEPSTGKYNQQQQKPSHSLAPNNSNNNNNHNNSSNQIAQNDQQSKIAISSSHSKSKAKCCGGKCTIISNSTF